MKKARASRRYALALMGVAEEQNAVDRIASDLELIDSTLRVSRELRHLIASPVVNPSKKKGAIHAIFGERIGGETRVFIDLLVDKERASLLPEIAEQFARLRDDKEGIVNVDVTSAAELAPAQRQNLRANLERYTGKKVRVRVSLDGSLKGGLRVQIGDTVLDASVRRQLELLRLKFLEGATH